MPTLTRDHTGPYAEPDVDPPWECEPEADPVLLTECRVIGEAQGEKDYAAGIVDLPDSELTGEYWESWREGWRVGFKRAEAEWESAGVTQAEFILPRAA